jgi:hypothetical protein
VLCFFEVAVGGDDQAHFEVGAPFLDDGGRRALRDELGNVAFQINRVAGLGEDQMLAPVGPEGLRP